VTENQDNLKLLVDILLKLNVNLKMNLSPLSIQALHDIIDEYWEDSLANRSVDLASVKLLLFKSSIDA
jgi:hypothetical protein